MTYEDLRHRLATALEAAIAAQAAGRLADVEIGFDELDELLPRDAGARYAKLHVALRFWDCWIDASRHEWQYYEGLTAESWCELAGLVVAALRADRDLDDARLLRFAR